MSIFQPFSIDSRTLESGDCFVALDGTKQKGHMYLEAAFKRGASAALVSLAYRNEVESMVPAGWFHKIQFVADPARAMAEAATQHRRQFQIPIVGVAGSVGKTSTKEFLAFLLRKKYAVLATTGNLNNHLGLPMMLSRLRAQHGVAVLEMGADHSGDLDNLVKMAWPTHALLTPIAPEHLAGFGSLAGVYDGELEVLNSPLLKTLVTVQGDPELDRRLAPSKIKMIRVGFAPESDLQISQVRVIDGKTHFLLGKTNVILPLPAAFMAVNAALAAAMALELGLVWDDLSGEWDVQLPGGRFHAEVCPGDFTVIDDTYNSSPLAFKAAVQTLSQLPSKRKWIIFADMLELGKESRHWHAEAGRIAAEAKMDFFWAFGPESRTAVEFAARLHPSLNAKHFESCDNLCHAIKSVVHPGDLILLKGSRGMRVERVFDYLKSLSRERV